MNGPTTINAYQQRINPRTLKVLADRCCSNCARSCDLSPFMGECHWEPRKGSIEITDDEARCSNCGQLVYTYTKICPNCCAVFRE